MLPKPTTAAGGPTVLHGAGLVVSLGREVALATARTTHEAVIDRSYAALRRVTGPLSHPVEVAQRGITNGVYASVDLALKAAAGGLDRLARTGVGHRLDQQPRGRLFTAAVNGVLGDEFDRDRSPLTVHLAIRQNGRDIEPTPSELAAAFGEPTGRLVLFLHGLCEDESHWDRGRERFGTTYADALATLGWTPVFLRLNTGLAVRTNGQQLAALLEVLTADWPVPVERIALVGHSMGGLIARAATAAPREHGASWVDLVTDVITLGTPHLGSPVAKAAHWGSGLLRLTPESRAFSTNIIERRSVGIRDLTDGFAHELPPLESARYRVVAATLAASAEQPMGAIFGDILVRPGSATGRHRSGELFPGSEKLFLGSASHLSLLNHPEVLVALETWLA